MFLLKNKKYNVIMNERMRMALQLAIHCAPVLTGVKASNMIMVSESERFLVRELLSEINLGQFYIKTNYNKNILYLYREEKLMNNLTQEDVSLFLNQYGYYIDNKDGSCLELLECLAERLHCYYTGQTTFPHEIGVFLEYPLPDVEGFIRHAGRNYLYSGYWKVYYDVENAKKKFREYDGVRKRMLKHILEGAEHVTFGMGSN